MRPARPSLWSRARNRTDTFPSVVAVIERLPVENAVIGGETALLLADGRPDFGALRSKHACRDARLIAFDLRGVNGEDLRRMPLDERRSRPASQSAGPEDAPRFPSNVQGEEDGPVPARVRDEPGGDRVSKRIDASSHSGPFHNVMENLVPGLRPAVKGRARPEALRREQPNP